MNSVRINMPQMAVRGLSENWLFKFCGDLHWQEVCRRHGVTSDQMADTTGRRVYTSFVAIRARYARPLCSFGENDVIAFATTLDRFGPAVIRSRVRGLIGGREALSLELMTKFVARDSEGKNELRQASIRAAATEPIDELAEAPPLIRDFQSARGGKAPPMDVGGPSIALTALQGARTYEPNPFTDFNGAGLLYFAAYPTIAEHLERLIIMAAPAYSEHADRDWALMTSTTARDVYYFGNLDLGLAIAGRLTSVAKAAPSPEYPHGRFHTEMSLDDSTGRRLASISALKAITR